jgi:hypothetical protein
MLLRRQATAAELRKSLQLFEGASPRRRRNSVPQAQAAQAALKRLKHAPAPQSYEQVFNSSKVHRREEYLASVQMALAIFTLFFYSSAECSSPVAAGNGLGTGLGTTTKNVRTC